MVGRTDEATLALNTTTEIQVDGRDGCWVASRTDEATPALDATTEKYPVGGMVFRWATDGRLGATAHGRWLDTQVVGIGSGWEECKSGGGERRDWRRSWRAMWLRCTQVD